MEFKRVTKKESEGARKKAKEIIEIMRNSLKEKYIFDDKLVGSVVWNTILRDQNNMFDIDIQLILSNNSKLSLNNPTKVKEDFFNCLNEAYSKKKGIVVQNSTTAITYIDNNNNYSIDFVLLRFSEGKGEIIRRNNDTFDASVNKNTWNMLTKYNEAYTIFKNLSNQEKEDLIENHILPEKYKEKKKKINGQEYVSSYSIFIREVNNYVYRKRNNRL